MKKLKSFAWWTSIVVVLPGLAWCVVYVAIPAGFEDACQRSLSVDSTPFGCSPFFFLFGVAVTIVAFQWCIVVPLVVWSRWYLRRSTSPNHQLRHKVWMLLAAFTTAFLAFILLFSNGPRVAALGNSIGQFWLPLMVLVVPAALFATGDAVPSARVSHVVNQAEY